MDPITSVVAGFLRAFWREILIISLLSSLWIAHEYVYTPKIENLELRLAVEEGKLSQCQQAFTDQSDKIIEESEETKRIVSEGFSRLEEILENMQSEEKQQIIDIISEEVPESCDDLNLFLIEMVERLRW